MSSWNKAGTHSLTHTEACYHPLEAISVNKNEDQTKCPQFVFWSSLQRLITIDGPQKDSRANTHTHRLSRVHVLQGLLKDTPGMYDYISHETLTFL